MKQQSQLQQSQLQQSQQPIWEMMKENTAPLERGRNVMNIEQKYSSSSTNDNGTLLQQSQSQQQQVLLEHHDHMIQQFEENISNPDTTKHAHDPIVLWVSYIKYLQDHVYISSNSHSKCIFPILERCVQTFCCSHTTTPNYQNDIRYIRICCLYADQTMDPLSTFHILYTHYSIGTSSAIYYNAWAYIAEKYQQYIIADQIFRIGLLSDHHVQQPISYLQQRYIRFQKRMNRYWINAMNEQEQHTDDDDPNHAIHIQELTKYHNQQQQHHENTNIGSRRAILGSLSSTIHRHSQQQQHHHHQSMTIQNRINTNNNQQQQRHLSTFTDRTSSIQQQQQALTSTNTSMNRSFQIFSDTTSPKTNIVANMDHSNDDQQQQQNPSFLKSQPLLSESDRYKENRGKVELWNEHGSLKSAYNNTTTIPSIDHGGINSTTSRSSYMNQQQHTINTKTNGFMIHIDDECKVQNDYDEQQQQLYLHQQRLSRDDRIQSKQSSKYSRNDASSSTTTKKQTKQKPIWKHHLLTNPISHEEQSFEEARCHSQYYTIVASNNNFNLLCCNNNNINDDTDIDDEMSMSMEEFMSIQEESIHSFHSDIQQQQQQYGTTTPICQRTTNHITTGMNHETPNHPKFLNNHDNFINKNNMSTASSTCDYTNDDGIRSLGLLNSIHKVNKHDEPTINTQFALRELSVMFASPAPPVPVPLPVAAATTSISNENQNTDRRLHPTVDHHHESLLFEIYADEPNDGTLPNESFAQEPELPNITHQKFDIYQDVTEVIAPLYQNHKQNDMSVPAVSSLSFSIFCDDNETKNTIIPSSDSVLVPVDSKVHTHGVPFTTTYPLSDHHGMMDPTLLRRDLSPISCPEAVGDTVTFNTLSDMVFP